MAPGTGLRVFDDLDTVLEQKRRGDSRSGGQAAGWTAALEVCPPDVLRLRHGKTLPGTKEKILRDIQATRSDHPGPASEDISSVAANQVRCRARGGQAAQLFRADREPVRAGQCLQAGGGWPEFPVITGTEPGQAGTNENNFMLCV